MSVYALDRPVVFVAPCGGLIAATVNGEDLPEFIRDHHGWRLEVRENIRHARWCDQTDGCRPAITVEVVEHVCECCDQTFEAPPLPEDCLPVCPDCSRH